MAPEVIASIIAAATALVAVVVGPFVTIRAAKKQMLGPMRQAWINSLRDTVSEYLAHLSVGRMQMSTSLSDNDDIRSRHQLDERARLQEAYRLKERICLLINPKEADHQELVRLVESAYSGFVEGRDTAGALHAIRTHTQGVLKREWEVVKQ